MTTCQVILTESVPSLGSEADIVKVRAGYARNFLLPQGKALEVTASSLRKIKQLQIKKTERENAELEKAKLFSEKIEGLSLSLSLIAGESGKVFGSITASEIINALMKNIENLTLTRHAIQLDSPIKSDGSYEIPVKLHPSVICKLLLKVEIQNKSSDPVAPKKAFKKRKN